MSKKFWIVFSPDLGYIETGYDRRILPDERVEHHFGIFFREESANQFAQQVAIKNPGVEIQVAEAKGGYFAPPPKAITKKVWTPSGEYISE